MRHNGVGALIAAVFDVKIDYPFRIQNTLSLFSSVSMVIALLLTACDAELPGS